MRLRKDYTMGKDGGPKWVLMLKIPQPSVVKGQASEPVVWSNKNTAHTGEIPEDRMRLPKRQGELNKQVTYESILREYRSLAYGGMQKTHGQTNVT